MNCIPYVYNTVFIIFCRISYKTDMDKHHGSQKTFSLAVHRNSRNCWENVAMAWLPKFFTVPTRAVTRHFSTGCSHRLHDWTKPAAFRTKAVFFFWPVTTYHFIRFLFWVNIQRIMSFSRATIVGLWIKVSEKFIVQPPASIKGHMGIKWGFEWNMNEISSE